MDGDETLDERTLRRIIALLVSFAALAERVADRSFPVRWFLLVVLRYAENVAVGYVIESAPWAWPYLDEEPEPGSSPMDAVLLGQRLRMLAAILGELLPPTGETGRGWTAGRDVARDCRASRIHSYPVPSGGGMRMPYDTS
jgi:hypothetical protein